MKKTLFILITLFTTQIFACQCGEINEEYIEKLKQKVDYIFIGTVVENINLNNSEITNILWKRSNSSSEVIIKVEKVIQGKLSSKFIYINQQAGNCSRGFKNGEKYVISGFKINGFIDLSPKLKSNLQNENKKIESNKIPTITRNIRKRPSVEFKEHIFYFTNIEMDFKNWNELSKTETVISTSICTSGTLDSHFGKLITNEK
jgi:hypothetical protein